MSPFADLSFFVYKLSSTSENSPSNEAFAQSVEAARKLPLVLTLVDKVPFELENAVAAEKLFTAFPEIRPGLQPLVNVELPIWAAYLDGKLSRAEALDQMVAAFVKTRK